MKKIKIGLDFDGVVAYNPFRVIRAPVVFFKRNVLGITKTKFLIPKNPFQQFVIRLMHESSVFPARGVDKLIQLANNRNVELHLITGRMGFLAPNLYHWLKKYQLDKIFTSINFNANYEQPHFFKQRIISELGVDYFIEDNWDVVNYLQTHSKTKVYWIYNFLDRGKIYEYKFPYLQKALDVLMHEITF